MRHLPLFLLSGLLLWAPLPFGSVTPWGVLVLIALTSLLVAGLLVVRGDQDGARVVPLTVAALAGLGALGWLQASGWVGAMPRLLGGDSGSNLPATVREVLQPSLSLAPALSRQAATGWWTVTLLLVAAIVVGRHRLSRPVLLTVALVSALFQGLYGWRQWHLGPGEIWGRAVPGPRRLRGTLVSGDHLAVMFEIMLAVCIGWMWWAWRRSRQEPRLERRVLMLALPALGAVGCAIALVDTGSRAALGAVVLGLVFQAALVFGPRGRWVVPGGLLVLVLLAGGLLVSKGPQQGLGRQLSRPVYEVLHSGRAAVWGPALELWRSSPWIGTGLGTFEEGFPRVQPAELMKKRWGRAHNDPLELLVTGGVVGVGLLAAALVFLIRRLWAVYRSGGQLAARASALAALAALPPVALHECFDFGLTVPANTVLLTVLLGIGAAGPTVQERGAAPLRSRR